MDLVYVTAQSKWNENELKYSLRSAEKNLLFDKVFIIGYLPPFISPYKVIHIPFKESIARKWRNVEKKFDLIVNNPDISDDFIFMNDDFWIFKKYKEFPYYYQETLEKAVKVRVVTHYIKRMENTLKLFPNAKNFELHCPIVFNKNKLKKLFDKYGSEGIERRSAYCAEYNIKGIPFKDYKIFRAKDLPLFKNVPFLSATDKVAIDKRFQDFLMKQFPNSSYYEIDEKDKLRAKIDSLTKAIEIYKKLKPDKYLNKKEELKNKLDLLKSQI